MADYIIAKTDDEYRSAALLFKEYAAGLNIDLSLRPSIFTYNMGFMKYLLTITIQMKQRFILK